ncbi:MAG: N-methyl-L-tryptophan oxidase [Ktedonobacteraceae bacterium]
MQQHKIVIVGAGIIGLATAYSLLKQGIQHVTVLEQASVGHERAASHGFSRLLRFEYGDDAFYSEMVCLSQRRWKNLEQVSGKRLYTPTGILMLGHEHDDVSNSSYRTLRNLGHTPERLTGRSCEQRFPQFNTTAYDIFIYNMNAGMLHASRILKTLQECILSLGGEIIENQRVTRICHDNTRRPIRLKLATGGEMLADRVVVAAGPWVHRLLGDLQLPVHMTRQHLLYFANLPPSAFGLYAFPAFMADDLYGFPIHSTCTDGSGPHWLKAASHSFGPPADPVETTSLTDEKHILSIAERLYTLLPALRHAELIKTEAYIYDVSQDEHFILDHLPNDTRVTFATGLTGHAFKFGLLLGDVLSSLVCETEPTIPIERFRLARFSRQLQPSVA